MDWRDAPPYGRSCATTEFRLFHPGAPEARGPEFAARYRARCYCGAVEYEVRDDPVDAKICHCRACQVLHGSPFQWAVIFHKADVRFVRGVDNLYFYNSELDQPGHVLPCKLSCERCRAPIADEGRRMFLAFGPLFDFGAPPRVPASFQPTCHIFYGSRVIDVDDGKPKFAGHKDSSPLVKP